MDCSYYYKLQVARLRAGDFTFEVAAILVDNIKLLVASGKITYGYLETTADELEYLLGLTKSKLVSVNKI